MTTVQVFPVTEIATNCLLIRDTETGHMAVVDPGGDSSQLLAAIESAGPETVKYILLTHGHYDHIGRANQLAQQYQAKIVIGSQEKAFLTDNSLNLSYKAFREKIKPFQADVLLHDSDTFQLGNTEITFITTPGHTIGGGCYLFDDVLVAGDTLFFESIGRTDLPTGDNSMMIQSLAKLKNLPGDYTVYPGHGRLTTLNHERSHNPYMTQMRIY